MTTVEFLKETRAKLAQGWTQREFARKDGEPTGASALDSDCWCVVGALGHVALLHGDYFMPAKFEARSALVEAIGSAEFERWSYSLPHWNDAPERTQEDVLALFDKAIAAEEAKA